MIQYDFLEYQFNIYTNAGQFITFIQELVQQFEYTLITTLMLICFFALYIRNAIYFDIPIHTFLTSCICISNELFFRCFQVHSHFIHHEFTAYLMQIILISIWTLNTEEYMDT